MTFAVFSRRLLAGGAALALSTLAVQPAVAQSTSAATSDHAHHMPSEPTAETQSGAGEAEMGMMSMPGLFGPYPMEREASGTSWQPQLTAPGRGMADMRMIHSNGWMLMGHVSLDLVYDSQGGRRGGDKGFLAGMVMGMASRPLAGGTLSFRGMLSPDPFMGKSGYPLLLATGETADGAHHLIDRQHPHDFFAELAVAYSRPITSDISGFLYVAPVGEPAIGPPAFMHRSSAMDSPEAPITHHWLDSTHIAFGVVTAGLVRGPVKLEVSGFQGREPDQHRFDIETPKLDSVALRATWNPSERWSMQASWARLHSPEQLDPDKNEDRFTTSVAYARPVFSSGVWSTTLAYGRKSLSPGGVLNAALAESELVIDPRWTLFSRAEWKEDDELAPHHALARVGKLSFGAIRDFRLGAYSTVGVGALGSVYALPQVLKPLYGSSPVSGMLFLRFRSS